MNYSDRYLRQIASYPMVDVMLADVAIRIQLSPTDYQLAVDHYHAINEWLERDDSPLSGIRPRLLRAGRLRDRRDRRASLQRRRVRHRRHGRSCLSRRRRSRSRSATLHDAIRGERGSRYHFKTDRKTRCSTVNYDGMHLDVTPTVRLAGHEREDGTDLPLEAGRSVRAEDVAVREPARLRAVVHRPRRHRIKTSAPSSNGARWTTTANARFSKARRRGPGARAVPCLPEVARRHRAAVDQALAQPGLRQATHERRLPPSVLLAFYVASHANQTTSLAEKLSLQVETHAGRRPEHAHDRGEKVFASNPMCQEDILTDRWPET